VPEEFDFEVLAGEVPAAPGRPGLACAQEHLAVAQLSETTEKPAGLPNPKVRNVAASCPKPLDRLTTAGCLPPGGASDFFSGLFQKRRASTSDPSANMCSLSIWMEIPSHTKPRLRRLRSGRCVRRWTKRATAFRRGCRENPRRRLETPPQPPLTIEARSALTTRLPSAHATCGPAQRPSECRQWSEFAEPFSRQPPSKAAVRIRRSALSLRRALQ
jgi:hypothetical protein